MAFWNFKGGLDETVHGRPISFPFDWIAPGEFVYGPRGMEVDLRLGPAFKDRWCRGRRAYVLRHLIAAVRRRLFKYPPLFWVGTEPYFEKWSPLHLTGGVE